MKCPVCNGKTRVVDVVKNPPSVSTPEVWRRRKCQSCGHSFYSVEYEIKDPDSKFVSKFWDIRERRDRIVD